jgi:hypothetical protein
MSNIPTNLFQQIVQKLQERGISSNCPRCGNAQFTLADGFFNQTIQKDLVNMTIGGPSIPTIVLICTKCGFVSQHALGVLGLLPTAPTTATTPTKQGST